ncbi:mechanosensitive ion channel [Flavobacterium sp. NST-5]|uniref:Mechanosensitive ion channel n=1 Tax=Flavobacterium ichthyis TaxID=2698827 RepID=A0ABW9Z4M4_9FLAO|nr:mechanosensitive ion channel family protein [Flavobacterium ichthyis]NBL63584.1 mechanosensitive ion channel [Flavobacterium ichthyis]
MIIQKIIFYTLLVILLSGAFNPANSQLLETPVKEATIEQIPGDSLGRRNPRGTVSGFFKAFEEQDFQRASQYLTLKRSYRNKKDRERVVKQFQQVLDQSGEILPYSLISNKNIGQTDDDLEPELDFVGSVDINGEKVSLLVENSGDEMRAVWKFSQETIEAITAVKIDDSALINTILPVSLKEKILAGVPIGHWLAIIVILAISYVLAWGLTSLINFIVRKICKENTERQIFGLLNAISLPLQLIFAVWIFVDFSQRSGISIIIRQRFSFLTVLVGIVAFLIFLWRITDLLSEITKNKMTVRGRVSAISVILFLKRTLKVAIFIFGAIAILGAIGIDVTTGLAALGIGGIALALGAQKTVENFVGSVTLVIDQPIRVGDFCQINDVKGTVEQIGMRSTKIRTTARTVVTIPNGILSATNIENYTFRDRFLFNIFLDLRYETTPDQLRFLLVELRKILYSHPKVSPDPARVRFAELGANSLKIEIFSYILADDIDDFQEVREDLLLRFIDLVAESGTGFAFPSQTLYFAQDEGISPEKISATEEKVKQWKNENKMHLPKFKQETIDQLRNTIEYPTKGSSGYEKPEVN